MNDSQVSNSVPLLSLSSVLAALAGGIGGFGAFLVGDTVSFLMGGEKARPLFGLVWFVAVWSGFIGLVIGGAILAYDNAWSLRGQWHRDLGKGLPLFFGLSFLGGAVAQVSFSFVQNSLTRGIGWALMGLSVGAGIGILRRDKVQALRGALGGLIGGFVGGFIFDWLAEHSIGGDVVARMVGLVLLGALVSLLMRVVQDALKSAWLLGISSGPFEGKEYPLNTARVSVGRAEYNDISLFREESTQAHMGALVYHDGVWWWQGESIEINGVAQSNAVLTAGDTLQIGAARFRFQMRSVKAVVDAPIVAPAEPVAVVGTSFALKMADGQLLTWSDSQRTVHLGRASQNEVVLPEVTVSSSHATLQVLAGRLSVIDQSSTNGTFVNGTKLTPGWAQPLAVGDRVRFGNVETVVQVV